MADEVTQTPSDTTTSETTPTDAPAADAPAADAPAADAPSDDDGSTVLGGKADDDTDAGKTDETVDELRGAPETYNLALEGVELDKDVVAEAEPILRELDLSDFAANKLLPVAKSLVDRTQDATLKALTDAAAQQRKDWLDIAKADEEIGGAKFSETTALAAKGLDALGFVEGHPFRKALNETGFGNHRDMLFAFRKIGELVGEDGFIRADGPPKAETATETRWYGNKGE